MTAAAPGERYPVDANGFVRQCAWCRRVADKDGRYRIPVASMVPGASHGCCEACGIRYLMPKDSPPSSASLSGEEPSDTRPFITPD